MAESKDAAFSGWAVTAEEVAEHFDVDLSAGLSSAEAAARLEKYGANELDAEEGSTLWDKMVEQFDDPLVKILLVAAVVSFVLAFFEETADGASDLTAYVEPFVILLILIINAFVGVWQEDNAESALEALKQMQAETVAVTRDGKLISEMPAAQLVPGDVIVLNVGDKVPADCRVCELHTATCRLEQMSLTGESVAVSKYADTVVAEDAIIQAKTNVVFSSTAVANGKVTCVVLATGMQTEIGKLQQDLNTEAKIKNLTAELNEMKALPEAKQDVTRRADLESQLVDLDDTTPLGKKLEDFGELLTKIIGYICLLVWIINYKNFLDTTKLFAGDFSGAFNFGKCTYYFKIAVALAVAAIPEGLPAVITTCLALGTRKMAKRNALVRKLPSVETLGCTTVICSDKTGTLTTNQMSVTQLVVAGSKSAVRIFEVEGATYSPIDGVVVGLDMTEAIANICKVCTLCNESKIEYKLEARNDEGKITQNEGYERTGAPTEAALRVLAEKIGVTDDAVQDDIDAQRASDNKDDRVQSAQSCSDYWAGMHDKKATLEFSRDRKSMSVICAAAGAPADSGRGARTRSRRQAKTTGSSNGNVLFVKGAPEGLLERSTHVMLESGEVVKMSKALRDDLLDTIEEMSDKALRCLGFAMRDDLSAVDLDDYDGSSHGVGREVLQDVANYAEIENKMTFLGVAGMKDPPRKQVAQALVECDQAGIRVMVITGDNKHTAEAICRQIGLFGAEEDLSEVSFEGRDFIEMDKEEQLRILGGQGGRVFSRAEPAHKSRIISLLKSNGEVAAMTGDGVNDAPALKLASIGIAMGISGTEVAKQASDMVLADDNFATIVHAVEEGRSIYNNMKAFIRYMISSNVGEVASIFLTAVLGMPEGLIPVQLLWVNLVTDGPPATALGFNPADKDIMTRPPRSSDDKLINGWTFFRYMVIGVYVGVATVGVFGVWYTMDSFMGIDLSEDGHHLVSYHQLTNWESCSEHAAEWFKGVTEVGYTAGHHVIKYEGDKMCDYFTAGKTKASTLSLSVLVTIEMFNALNALSEDGSLLTMPPWVNPWLLGAMAISFILHFMILYVDFFCDIFSIVPLSVNEWLLVLAFSFPVILIDEVLKFVGRRMAASERATRAAAKKNQ